MQPQRKSARLSKSIANQPSGGTQSSMKSSTSGLNPHEKRTPQSTSLGIKPHLKKITEKRSSKASSVLIPQEHKSTERTTTKFGYLKSTEKSVSQNTCFGNKKKNGPYSNSFGYQENSRNHNNVSQALNSNKKSNNGMHTSSFESSSSAFKIKERAITLIKDINPMISNMAVKGRCVSVWHSHKFNEPHDPYSLDCVFQYVENNRIQFFVKKELMFKFEPLLQEGQCYIISNFGVAENSGRLPLLPNRWKISFYKGTEVTRIDQIDDNFAGFVNEPFTRLLDPNNEYHEHDSVDVIGTVISIGNIVSVNGYGCSKIRRTIVIEDAESLRIECTFWDKWALMWNEYANKLDKIGHLDFMLILGKVKYWNNKPVIQNALFGTRIFINKEFTPFLAFRSRYEAQNGYDASEFRIQIHNQATHVVTPAEFMQGSLKRMVGMIRNIIPETHCVVYATVYSIDYENGWAYTGCKICNTKVTPIVSKGSSSSKSKKQLWNCRRHGEIYAVVSRFKIIVRIFDETGTAQVVIFDNNVHKMTNISAWEIMEEHGMDTDEYFPDELNQIIGKQYLFKVKYSEFNHNNNSHVYRVEKVSDDAETINYFRNGFFPEDDGEDADDDYTSNYVEENEDIENTVTTPSNEVIQDEEDDVITTSNDMNEDTIDDTTTTEKNKETHNVVSSNDIINRENEAFESEKEPERVFINLSDIETEDEDENEDFNTNKKMLTVKLEKDP